MVELKKEGFQLSVWYAGHEARQNAIENALQYPRLNSLYGQARSFGVGYRLIAAICQRRHFVAVAFNPIFQSLEQPAHHLNGFVVVNAVGPLLELGQLDHDLRLLFHRGICSFSRLLKQLSLSSKSLLANQSGLSSDSYGFFGDF